MSWFAFLFNSYQHGKCFKMPLIFWLYIFIDDFYENYFHFYLTFPFLSQIFPQKFLTNNISLTIFQIYNLCIEEDYDPSHFHGRVEKFPFDDNHVPNFEMMKLFCESVHSWLSNDPKNIGVIHCMVLLSSFFLFSLFLFNTWWEIIQSSFILYPRHAMSPRLKSNTSNFLEEEDPTELYGHWCIPS